ncbi:hypothetical protein [Kitasatospora sp. NBC_01302]|uniref:hypothetical protein n=1 Tax=Kitasatospora sp. NBC_01302 TaxID=2903575 RepID=UPI002E113DF0|nr:hypothetical protein OG294_03795 [Kitasatospora sp. NBC_01302]
MDQFLGDDGLPVSEMTGQLDWREDGALSAQISAMSRRQRYQAAYLALRRLQAPLLTIEMPLEWGVETSLLGSLFRAGAAQLDGEVNENIDHAVAELVSAPLFESQIEPEFSESFQLEAINGWLMLSESLGEMSEEQTDRLVGLAREMAFYLDSQLEGSLTVVAGEAHRESYLAGVDDRFRAYRLGYFGTRNLEIEGACHESVLVDSLGDDLLGSDAGRRLAAACDEYSGELSSALQAFAIG